MVKARRCRSPGKETQNWLRRRVIWTNKWKQNLKRETILISKNKLSILQPITNGM